MNPHIPEAILALQDTRKKIEELRDLEKQIKDFIFAELYAHIPLAHEGTVNTEVGAHKLAATFALDRKIDLPSLEATKDSPNWNQLAPVTVLRWNPDISLKIYRSLRDEGRGFIDSFLVIKPKTPTLLIK
jgi:hypothetical protein